MAVQNFTSPFHFSKNARRWSEAAFVLRFWLGWLLIVATLSLAVDAYFEYRNSELDRRLEKINDGLVILE